VAGIVLAQAFLAYMVTDSINRYGLTNIHGYVMVGMSYLYDGNQNEPVKFMWHAYLFGIIITLFIIVVCSVRIEKLRWIMHGVFIVIELILSVRAATLFTDAAAIGTYRDLTISAKIESLLNDDMDNRRIIYITEDDESFISTLQFVMRDEEITLLPLKGSIEEYTREELNESDILVLYYKSIFSDEAGKMFSSSMLNGHFYIYYNMPNGGT
jgi:hypothetical protein